MPHTTKLKKIAKTSFEIKGYNFYGSFERYIHNDSHAIGGRNRVTNNVFSLSWLIVIHQALKNY